MMPGATSPTMCARVRAFEDPSHCSRRPPREQERRWAHAPAVRKALPRDQRTRCCRAGHPCSLTPAQKRSRTVRDRERSRRRAGRRGRSSLVTLTYRAASYGIIVVGSCMASTEVAGTTSMTVTSRACICTDCLRRRGRWSLRAPLGARCTAFSLKRVLRLGDV